MKKTIAKTLKKVGFFRELIFYRHYIFYSAKAKLKSDIAETRLAWLWWVLEPFLKAMIYTVIMGLLMGRKRAGYEGIGFGTYIFIGVSVWSVFRTTISTSTTLIKSYGNIIRGSRIPKFILLINDIVFNLINLLFSIIILIPLYILSGFEPTVNLLLLPIPIFILLLTAYWIGLFLLHIGVFIHDLKKVVNTVLILGMYCSGVIFPINTVVGESHPAIAFILLHYNPAACMIQQLKYIALGDGGTHSVEWLWVLIWFVAGIILSVLGLKLVSKYDNSYIKLI